MHPHSPRSKTHAAPRRPQPERRRSSMRQPGAPSEDKSVHFAPHDMLVLLPTSPTCTRSQIGAPVPIAPAAPAPERAARAGGCLTQWLGPRTAHIVWPSDQRYEGPVDRAGAPHGQGLLRMADDTKVLDSTWIHGRCDAVAGSARVPRRLEPYTPPKARRASAAVEVLVQCLGAPGCAGGPKPGPKGAIEVIKQMLRVGRRAR